MVVGGDCQDGTRDGLDIISFPANSRYDFVDDLTKFMIKFWNLRDG